MPHRVLGLTLPTRAIWFVLVVASLFSDPLTRTVFAEAKVTVTPNRVVAGQSVTVAGTGWAPNDQILISFTDPTGNILPLGIITADSRGNFNQAITVPATVPAGTYQIDGNGQGGSVAITMTIVAPSPTTVPVTATTLPSSSPVPTVSNAEPSAVTESPTATLQPSETPSPPPTATLQPSETPTLPPTATPTSTPTPTSTSTPTMTSTSTATTTSTSTSTPTPTTTNTPTLPERIVTTGQGTGPIGWILLILLGALVGYAVGRRR